MALGRVACVVLFAIGLSAQYGNSPKITYSNAPVGQNSFGQFINGVPLIDQFTLNIDPNIVSQVSTITITENIPGQSPVVIKTFQDTTQQVTYSFNWNVGAVPDQTTWVVDELTSKGTKLAEVTYTFYEISLPTWLDPKTTNNGTTTNQVTWDPYGAGTTGAYVFAQQSTLMTPQQEKDNGLTFSDWLPFIGGKGITYDLGGVVNFSFDLNGKVVPGTLDYGPAAFFNVFGYQNYVHLHMQWLPNLLGISNAAGP